MANLPEIRNKVVSSAFKKPEAVQEFEHMADAEARRLHPEMTHLAHRTFSDDTSNELMFCVKFYLRLPGAFVIRLNNMGVYDRRLNKYRPDRPLNDPGRLLHF